METSQNRTTSLENHIQRIGRSIDHLEEINRKFFWYRLIAFATAVVIVWAGFTFASYPWDWVIFAAAVLGFIYVVNLNSQLKRHIERFKIWKKLNQEQLARLTLDWGNIPKPAWMPDDSRSPLATDLDLTGLFSLHQLVDVSTTHQGSQCLAEWLTQGVPDLETINYRHNIVKDLIPLRRFRLRYLINYRESQRDPLDGEKLLAWLQVPFPKERLRWLLPTASLLVLVNIILFILSAINKFPPFWIGSFVLYIGFYYYNSNTLNEFLDAVVHMDSELGKIATLLSYIESYPIHNSIHLEQHCSPIRSDLSRPSAFLRRVKLITAAAGLRMNPIVSVLLNVVFPWDFFFAYWAGNSRSELSSRLPTWLETLYTLEALSGLANLGELNPNYTFPEIIPDFTPVFNANQIGHPLLRPNEKICNNFSISDLGEVVVITGSNMAGKSTFLKTIGVNLCLAYAGGPVNATLLQSQPFKLHSCMRISESITDGFSYFYAEVRCLRKLLDQIYRYEEQQTKNRLSKDSDFPLLYLIDEIFRGTNNRERLIGSRAYVQTLIGKPCIGFIATHDLELASLSDGSRLVHNHHFREEVEEGRLVFDYIIRKGPCPTTNALKIMAMEGLPVEPNTQSKPPTTRLS